MLTERKVLPPLDHLLAFEAAAQTGSFARAADVLHISESAISRKVRLLELHYDLPLFVRGHRSISLTEHGRLLLARVETSMDNLRDVSQELFALNGSSTVRLAATNSVASLWLMPRLREFRAKNHRVSIMLVSSDSDRECLDDSNDLAILRGDGDWPGFQVRKLFGETVFPVCSPEYLKRNPRAAEIASLHDLSLIEVKSSYTEWMDWKSWLFKQGELSESFTRSAYFNTYPLAIQAAVDGEGVALGWGHLVDQLVDSGKLVRPLGTVHVRTESGYYLLKQKGKKPFSGQSTVEEWLLAQSAKRPRYNQTFR